jgi:hypothetical protein
LVQARQRSLAQRRLLGAIQFWRVRDWSSVGILSKPNAVHDIAFSPQPGIFAYTQYSGGVTVSFARFIH